MKQLKISFAVAVGLLTGLLTWAASPSDSYVKVEASSLVRMPQNSWARAILFSDVLLERPAGRVKRLDRKNYLAIKLKDAGTAWVPEPLVLKFQKLEIGGTYSFAGTVDQISRRYYLIVDSCYDIQTAEDMSEHWTDMLNPNEPSDSDAADGASPTGMQTLLLEAQNSLIKMAADNNMTVAQLIKAQSDGGQRIAESIVADALQGELKAQHKTADEMMIGAVLSLLQKESALKESTKAAKEVEALQEAEANAETLPAIIPEVTPPVAIPEDELPISELLIEEPMAPIVEEDAVVEEEVAVQDTISEPTPAAEDSAPVIDVQAEAPAPVEEIVAATSVEELEPVSEIMPDAATDTVPPAAVDTMVALLPPAQPAESASDELAAEEASSMPQAGDESVEAIPEPTVEEAIESAGMEMGEASIATPPSSMLVVPMSDPQLEMEPFVSTEPTKAELARMKKQDTIEKRERVPADKKSAAAEAKAKRIADKKARKEAKRLAAAKKIAKAQVKKEAQIAEARAKKMQAEEAKRLEQEEKMALEAVEQAELLQKEAAAARLLREETDAKLVELSARKAAAQQAMQELDKQKEAALKQLKAETEAESVRQAAERDKRMAEEKAKMADSIRMAKEVAQHELQVAADASASIESEVAARRAAEKKIKKLEVETRQLEAQTRKVRARLERELEAQRKMLKKKLAQQKRDTQAQISALKAQAENAQIKKAATLTPYEGRKKKAATLTPYEGRKKQKAAAKKAKKKAKEKSRKAEMKAKAAAEAQDDKIAPPEDGDKLPEWMQPVYEGQQIKKAATLTPSESRKKQKAAAKKAKKKAKAAAKEDAKQAKEKSRKAEMKAKAAAEAQDDKISSPEDVDKLPKWMQPVHF